MSNLNDVQKNLFQMLKEIDCLCKKYDIQYFLAGGTALGAVRNHQFLPWDDDIDIYITRSNWEKLKSILESESNVLPAGRSFIYNENTKYYCNPIPRYVDNTTTAIYKSQALPGKACGQHIEFLIMDPIPNDTPQRERYVELLRVYTELLSPYFVVNKNLSLEEWARHYELYKRYCRKVRWKGKSKVIKELEYELCQYSEKACKVFCMRWGIDILMYAKEDYGKGRLVYFEGQEFPVGEHAERIFRVAYGDSWMYVPENEAQVVHNALQDIEIPFDKYTKNYIPQINRKRVFKKYEKNKRSNASVFYYRRKMEALIAQLKVNVEGEKICQLLNSKEEYLQSLLVQREYDQLNEEFCEYKLLQCSKYVKKYKIYVPIHDEILYIWLKNLIEQGKYFEANKYLHIRETESELLSEQLLEIKEMIRVFRELSIARYDDKSEERVEQLIALYKGKFSDYLDMYRSVIWLNESDASSFEDYEALKIQCNRALDLYPFDGEIIASLAHATLKCGDTKDAMKLYKLALQRTRNGLIWEKIKNESGLDGIALERQKIEAGR